MKVEEAIRKRFSVRAYQKKKPEQEKIRKVLQAARLAPSASNRQDWRFVLVEEQNKRKELAGACKQEFIDQAPIIIAACGVDTDARMSCGHPPYLIDVSIAVDHMTLKAVEEDLGTCWIGAFDQGKAKEILAIPEEVSVVTLLTLGYPKGGPSEKHKTRKELSEITMQESWQNH